MSRRKLLNRIYSDSVGDSFHFSFSRMGIEEVKQVLMVLSGKGGVGKSSVSVQLAQGFLSKGLKVGILDVDICGPSIPRMLGAEDQEIHQSEEGLIPVLMNDSKLKVSSEYLVLYFIFLLNKLGKFS